MSVLSQIKSAFRKVFGGGSKSSSKSRSSYSRQSTTRASRVSNYGGGGSRSYRDYSSGGYRADYEDRQEAERRRRQEQARRKQATTDALASISKRTDALSSGKSSSVASSATSTGNGTERALRKIGQKIQEKPKAIPPDPKKAAREKATNDLKKLANDTSKALRVKTPEEMVKSGDYEYRPKAKNLNTPSASDRSTTRETLQGYKKRMSNNSFRVAQSATRGFGGGSTIVLEPLLAGNKDDKTEQEIERYYQENKSRLAEGAGTLAGAMVPYGGTAKAFERLGVKAVERAGATRLGRRLGAEALKRTMTGTGAKAALARSLVGDAIQDSTLGLADTALYLTSRDDLETAGDYAKALAKGQAINYGVGLAGNAVAHGLPVARRAWGNFADESRKLYFVPKGVGEGITDTGRRVIMNGGTTRTSRLNGLTREVGYMPNKLKKGTKATPPIESAPQKTTSEILQGYSSKGSKKKLSDAQKVIKQHIASGNTKAAREEVARVVDEVVRDTKIVEPMDATIKDIKDELKNTRISISDKAKADAGYKSGGYNAFRQKNFSAFKLTKDGTPVDDLWLSLQERYGRSLFPDEITDESAQLQYLADLAKTTDKKIDLADDEIAYLKDELSNSLWESANKGTEHAPWNMRDEDWQTSRAAAKPIEEEELAELERRAIENGDIEPPTAETPKVVLGNGKRTYTFEVFDLDGNREVVTIKANKASEASEIAGQYGAGKGLGWSRNITQRTKTQAPSADDAKVAEQKGAEKSAAKEPEAKSETPKTRKRKPSKSEQRLEEVRAEIKALDDEIDRLKANGEDTIEPIRKALNLRNEQKQLEKNIRRAEKAREKRATDKAMKRFEEAKNAEAEKATKESVEPKKSEEPKVESKKAEEPKAEPKTESSKLDVVAKEEAADTGRKANKKAESGERTEFRRGEEATAKEKARDKRTTEKRAKATKESFDKDVAEFRKKVDENREKVNVLEGRLRAATTAEQKQTIKDEIRALDEEIKRMYRKASLKYHPDRGGTKEWFQEFNNLNDDYTKRVYSSRGFKGASSKKSSSAGSASGTSGTRSSAYKEYRQKYRKTEAGGGNTPPPKSGSGNGGGNTPPPRGGRYSDYDGLRRPRGYAKRTERAMNTGEDLVGATKTKKTWRESFRTFRDEADRKFVDSMKDFEQIARERKKTEGKGAMQKLYGAIDKARRYRAIATTSVGSHQMKWDGTRYQVKGADGVMRDAPSVAEIFSGMDKDTEKSFNFYLLLNHNVDRLREGKPVFENTVLVKDKVAERLGISRSELDKALGRGEDIDLMDGDVSKALAEVYETKFPDFKDRAAQVRQYTANELNNRVRAGLLSKETMDEWLHKYPNYVPTYREGLFDSVSTIKGSTVKAGDLKAAKGSDLNIYDVKEQLADATVRNWRDISLNNLLEQTFGENIAKLSSSSEVSPYIFALDHTMNVGKSADGGKYYAEIYRDGKAERIEIEKRFYDDLKDLYKNGRMGNGLDALNDRMLVPLADKWKKLITEWSPIFMVKNAMRDFPEAVINSRSRKEFLSITADGSALKDLLSNGKFSRSLRDAGISASTFIDIDKAVKAFEKGEGGLATLVPRLNAGVELYPRLVEYMATLKKAGYDLKTVNIEDIPMNVRDMAAANAADVTVNFGRSGSVGKMINKGAVPFFNPSIQGWSKFARNISELDGMKDTLGFLLSASALGAAPMVATNLLYQNNPNYQQISPRDKANNYIIAIPPLDDNADTFIKIPRSRFASVYGLPLVNVANENKADWATAIKIIQDQVAPINPLESHLGANLIQAARNKTWYDTPIESESMQSLPANERYDATTSGISVNTAQALNKATKGKVKVSPKKLDYVLDANLGVVADVALPISTKANKGTGVPSRIFNVGKKAFVIDSATQNDLSSRYYDKATLLEQNKNSSEASKEDQIAYKKYKSWDGRVKAVTGAMRYIQASDMPNKQEAYRELAKLRNENMQKALDGKTSVNNTKDIRIIHKYAGTSYTIENLGKSADKNALKAYAASVYGDLSEDEMRKKIDNDTEFYKGYEGVVKTQNALQKVNPSLKGGNALTYAVGLADAGASDDVFAAYNTTLQSRTESASKAQRAKEYLHNNGSVGEFAQLENAVKSLGKLSDVDKGKLEDEAYTKLKRGEMSIDDYNTELKKIDYNANQSYVGKSVSLALSGAPTRAYKLYDIKAKNVQKGYNLAAMGIDARAYREMSQACDKDGNGYLKTAEIRDYVANSDFEDKATLFDALCYYSNVRNPFGTPKQYSQEQAAEAGKRKGVTQINVNAGADNTVFDEEESKKSGYGYRRRRYGRRWRHYGHGHSSKKAKVPTPKTIKANQFVKGEALGSTTKSSSSSKSSAKVTPPTLKRVQAKIDLPTVKTTTKKR